MTDQPIETLNFVESVRKRPGMFIGSVGIKGFNELLKQVFETLQEYVPDASVFEMGFYPGNRVVLELRNHQEEKLSAHIAAWHKHDSVYTIDWIKALVALSSDTYIMAGDLELSSKPGHFTTSVVNPSGNAGVIIDFTIDPEIFKDYQLVYDQVNPFLQQFAYLNPDLKIISKEHKGEDFQRRVFYYPRGIFEQMEHHMHTFYFPENAFKLYIEANIGNYDYRVVICDNKWLDNGFIETFAGNKALIEGGSLEHGVIDGMISAIKLLAEHSGMNIHINRKELKKHIAFMAAVKGKDFVFEGCTRTKLAMPFIKKEVQQKIHDSLLAYHQSEPKKADALLQNFCIRDEA